MGFPCLCCDIPKLNFDISVVFGYEFKQVQRNPPSFFSVNSIDAKNPFINHLLPKLY